MIVAVLIIAGLLLRTIAAFPRQWTGSTPAWLVFFAWLCWLIAALVYWAPHFHIS